MINMDISELQKKAEESVNEKIEYLRKKYGG